MHSFFILQFLFLFFSNSEGLSPISITSNKINCSTDNNYTSGSTFEMNLNQLLSSLPENTLKNDWFFNNTVGESPNKVYGLAMCYYDMANSNESCRDCLRLAAANLTQWCPNSIDAVVWYFECFVRYKYENFFSLQQTSVSFSYNDTESPPDPENFNKVLHGLTGKLIVDVATSPRLLAVGEANDTGFPNIYGFVQCTRDLSASECQTCLSAEAEMIPTATCNYESTKCSLYGINCHIRYETGYSPFYNPNLLTPPLLASHPPPPPKGSKSFHVVIVVSVVSVVVVFAIIGIFFWTRSHSKAPGNTGDDVVALQENVEQSLKYILNPNAEYQVFDLITLRKATDSFSDMNKLGKGGFGPVYKGIVPEGKEIAVKILSEGSGQGTREFKNEVDLLAKLKHKNLVQLLGCCIQKNQKMLCYEYLSNGSLDKILFAKVLHESAPLGWRVRFKIIEGISRGLHYLHEESRLKIIHRDLKASNILLDKDMNPKISDFGMARFFEEDQTHKDTSVIAGTFGYMAPEYALYGNFSAKSDVYSFGILVMEIVTGRKNSSFLGTGRFSNLTDHVLQHWNKGTISELKDPVLENEYLDEIKKCIHIALLCVQGNPIDRPNMETIKNMLSGNSKAITNLPLNLSKSTLIGCDFSDESHTAITMNDIMEGESSNTRSTIKKSNDYIREIYQKPRTLLDFLKTPL